MKGRPGPRTRLKEYVAAVMIFSAGPGLAQSQAPGNALPSPTTGATSQVTAISSFELWFATAIMVFGFIVLTMQFILLRRTEHIEPEDILRLFTVTMIIIGTLALIAVGYSSQQIAPALGLFGTILGYLLGKTDERIRGRQQVTAENKRREP